jgi:hypothetical protein
MTAHVSVSMILFFFSAFISILEENCSCKKIGRNRKTCALMVAYLNTRSIKFYDEINKRIGVVKRGWWREDGN